MSTPPTPAPPEDAAKPAPEKGEQAEHLGTDHLHAELGKRTIRGGLILAVAQVTKIVVRAASLILLARMLMPADFGLIAMVMAVAGFVAMFRDAGLSAATIQREEISHPQVSTLFWVNTSLGVLVGCIVAALAPVLAWFYGEPRLTAIALVLAGTFIFGGLQVQHDALLRRQMRFSTLAGIELTAVGTGILVAIVGAFAGIGYWALVAQLCCTSIVACLLTWRYSRWRPSRPAWAPGTGSMLAFGGSLSAASFINYIGSNLDYVLLGWRFGDQVVGLYTKAYEILTLPLTQINRPVRAVALPAMSRTQSAPDAYRSAYLSASETVTLVVGPLVVFTIVYGDHIIELILGAQWGESAFLFSTLGFAGILLPAWNLTGLLFISQARLTEHLKFHSIDLVAKVSSILIGLPWGARGVAIGVAVRYYVMVPVLFAMVGRSGPVSTRDLYRSMVFPLTATAATLAVVWSARRLVLDATPPLVSMLVGFALAAGTVFLILRMTGPGRTRATMLKSIWRQVRT